MAVVLSSEKLTVKDTFVAFVKITDISRAFWPVTDAIIDNGVVWLQSIWSVSFKNRMIGGDKSLHAILFNLRIRRLKYRKTPYLVTGFIEVFSFKMVVLGTNWCSPDFFLKSNKRFKVTYSSKVFYYLKTILQLQLVP